MDLVLKAPGKMINSKKVKAPISQILVPMMGNFQECLKMAMELSYY